MSRINGADILTRVEGHGSVELIRDGLRVVDARFTLFEAPRLFEALLVGRRFDEIPDIACRICSICSTVHKVVALQAVEQAMGIQVSQQTRLLRELAVYGGQIESHALHVFCLALPDYLGVGGFQIMAESAPELLQFGLKVKKLGNAIQETIGGRAIHPFNLLLGGVGKAPAADALKKLADQLSEVRADLVDIVTYVSSLAGILPPLPAQPFFAVKGDSALFGDQLVTSAGEVVPAQQAAAWLCEQVEPGGHAKVSTFGGDRSYFVGPMARLCLSMPGECESQFSVTSSNSFLKARTVELLHAVDSARTHIGQLLEHGAEYEQASTGTHNQEREATSLIEAPRGTLFHSYRFDGHGVCSAAQIITPTAINQKTIAASLKSLIEIMADADYGQIKVAAEVLIRCYDPCISCAVH